MKAQRKGVKLYINNAKSVWETTLFFISEITRTHNLRSKKEFIISIIEMKPSEFIATSDSVMYKNIV